MGLLQLLSQLSKLSQYNFQWASPSHPPYRQRKGLGQGQRKRQKQKRRQRQKQRQRKRRRPRDEKGSLPARSLSDKNWTRTDSFEHFLVL